MLIAANWKMNLSKEQSREMAKNILKIETDNKIVLFPAVTNVDAVGEIIDGSDIGLGVQNFHPAHEGAFTGEISLRHFDSNIEFVIVGHSERRHIVCDPPKLIARKVVYALEEGKKVVLCVGETMDTRSHGKTLDYIQDQLKSELPQGYPKDSIIIAYEPIWAIGSGKTPTVTEISEVADFIVDKYDLPVIYGGSVNPGNIKELTEIENISGFLIGGASLDINKFAEIIFATH